MSNLPDPIRLLGVLVSMEERERHRGRKREIRRTKRHFNILLDAYQQLEAEDAAENQATEWYLRQPDGTSQRIELDEGQTIWSVT